MCEECGMEGMMGFGGCNCDLYCDYIGALPREVIDAQLASLLPKLFGYRS